jgi:hypothetical protein
VLLQEHPNFSQALLQALLAPFLHFQVVLPQYPWPIILTQSALVMPHLQLTESCVTQIFGAITSKFLLLL